MFQLKYKQSTSETHRGMLAHGADIYMCVQCALSFNFKQATSCSILASEKHEWNYVIPRQKVESAFVERA